MRIYVVRHGQSEGNRQNLMCGWSDTPLSALGRAQAAAANAYLGNIPFDRIYCSDLPRARETAACALPGCTPICSPQLREVSVGQLAGLPMAQCHARYGENFVQAYRVQDFSAYGGETVQQMRSRVRGFIREQLEPLQGVEHVAVFGHEGTVHQMLCYALGVEVLLEHIRVDNASVSVFNRENGVWRLEKWNYTGTV